MLRSVEEQAAAFSSALLRPDRPVPATLVDPAGKPAGRRYAIYRNNVTVGLVEALAANFPVTMRLLGEEASTTVALDYARRFPPSSPLLFRYGASFPDFLEALGLAPDLLFLGDLARLERARLEAYHAADAPPLDATELAKVSPDDLGDLRLVLHPAMRIVVSPHAIVTLYEADPSEAGRSVGVPETALVTRPWFETRVSRLDPGTASFATALCAGTPLSQAAEGAMHRHSDFDLPAALSVLMSSGAFTRISDVPS